MTAGFSRVCLVSAAISCFCYPLLAQDADSGRPSGAIVGNCALTWEPVDSNTQSFTHRDTVGAHVTHLSGRYLWSCGSATMVADSAIKWDGPGMVELYGNVLYRDSVRTLRSEFLVYHQLRDLVVAERFVNLERASDGSFLRGPRVEFLRAVSGINAVTSATGRPIVTFRAENDEGGAGSFEIRADSVVFASEDEARFFGNAIIEQSGLTANADSAYLMRQGNSGVLWGSPRIETEGMSVEGDTVRFGSESGELRQVSAIGRGHAVGERFEVSADRIDVAMLEREAKSVVAYGSGIGEAQSGESLLYGDSLHFVLSQGRIDTIYSVGEAVAILGDSAAAAADSLGGQGEEMASSVGAGGLPGVGGAGDEGDLPAGASDGAPGVEGLNGGEDSTDEQESTPPELGIDGPDSWVRADTLVAIFERPGHLSTPDSAGAPAAAGAREPVSAGEATPADSLAEPGADPVMSRLLLMGYASALYRIVRDSTASARPSRNYLIGDRIQIDFVDGEPRTVTGENAVGIYLEPQPVQAAEDSLGASADSLDGAARDSLDAAPGDTAIATPPDTAAAAPPDTATATRPDTAAAAPPDTATATRPDTATATPPDTATATPPDTTTTTPRSVDASLSGANNDPLDQALAMRLGSEGSMTFQRCPVSPGVAWRTGAPTPLAYRSRRYDAPVSPGRLEKLCARRSPSVRSIG